MSIYVYSIRFQPILDYSSLFRPVPAYSSLSKPNPAYSSYFPLFEQETCPQNGEKLKKKIVNTMYFDRFSECWDPGALVQKNQRFRGYRSLCGFLSFITLRRDLIPPNCTVITCGFLRDSRCVPVACCPWWLAHTRSSSLHQAGAGRSWILGASSSAPA